MDAISHKIVLSLRLWNTTRHAALGFGVDIIGRRHAFNVSLVVCSVSCIITDAVPNWESLGFFIAILGFGAGSNLIMDTAVFLNGVSFSQAVAGFLAWGFLESESWNCSDAASCTEANNWKWRYTMFTGGALVFVMHVLRVTVLKLKETPKDLLVSTYLANKGAIFHRTQFETWRNYALINISGIPGPIVAVFMCNTMLGRKYTIAIGAMITMASFFAHTAVQTSMQDLTLTCVTAFCINI
ncbi:major facilitator superfamily transporter [Colletotrichum asianum]|uniref:Major facilitator superfamily transporter n=1 Tax=Colletotrichum asianum TaxID=702518 RepID=A0A8H3W3R4_9PEZI|nr:major facilitator superfamily transporter [Colletotrichum asianum]